MDNKSTFVELEYWQDVKTGEEACGDDYKTLELENEARLISVMSDGLGSGIKASLLSHMTTSMALNFISKNMEIVKSAEIIMDSLPVCDERKISYATFTAIDILNNDRVRIIEMDNPRFIHLRGNDAVEHTSSIVASSNWPDRKLMLTDLRAMPEDRIIFFSDGVSQAGLGHRPHKFGWRREGCLEFVRECVANNRAISSRDLSRAIVNRARSMNPGNRCIDDITCGVVYFRVPRRLRLLTGPPFKQEHDREYAGLLKDFNGKSIICGGTTAQIISRELGREIKTCLFMKNKGLPPISEMDGVNLVTEGILTLTETARCLEHDVPMTEMAPSVRTMLNLLIESDIIEFIVGTKVNEAHQDPSLPVDLEIRRNIVKKLMHYLERRFRKKTSVKYI
jgi:hypothetical protein